MYQSFRERIAIFVNSLFYPVLIALLAFFCWLLSTQFGWIPLLFYIVLCFLPLFSSDGRGYLPLLLFSLIITDKDIHFKGGIPYTMILSISFFFLSVILYIIIHKPGMVKGKLFYPLLILFSIFLISYFYCVASKRIFGSTGILYLIGFFCILVVYVLINSTLGKEDTLPYYCMSLCSISVAAALEVSVTLLQESILDFASPSFTLGWSYTRETVSTFLMLSIPFFSILIHRKKVGWFIPELFVFINLILLSTDSGLLSLMLFAIPYILFTLKDFSRHSPYYVMFTLLAIGIVFGILMGVNVSFNERIVRAVTRLNFFSDEIIDFYRPATKNFLDNPVLGSSMQSLVKDNGTLTLANNTLLTTAELGGSFGLVAFVYYEFRQYQLVLNKDSAEKWFLFLFLLNVDWIGLIDNTIYNIAILLILVTAMSTYQQSNRPDDLLIHEGFYQDFDREYNNLRNQHII